MTTLTSLIARTVDVTVVALIFSLFG